MTRYFHGGPGGLRLLEWIQPPIITGARRTDQDTPPELQVIARRVYRADRVYVATDINAAAVFAACARAGTIYEVAPFGELEVDEDCGEPGLSFACLRARVLRRWPLSPETARSIVVAMNEHDADVGAAS